ncbi:MAG: SDR family oxidoreductase [Bacteriovoracia bacterium]
MPNHPPFPAQKLAKPGLESKLNPRPRFYAETYRPAGKLKDKVALITGGDSGIGRAVALIYAREGADLALVYLPSEKSDALETQRLIEGEGREALLLPGDVTRYEFCERAVAHVVEHFSRLDILVNNAAYQQHHQDVDELSVSEWDHTFRTNIHGYFHMVKAASPHLNPGAVIINTGSITGLEGSGALLDYSATKGAIHAFTKSLAKNMVQRGIRVNCVAPGPVWTPLNPADRTPKEIQEFGADTPYGRPAQPEEVAPAYVFFASGADSNYITGEILTLLGGDTTAG